MIEVEELVSIQNKTSTPTGITPFFTWVQGHIYGWPAATDFQMGLETGKLLSAEALQPQLRLTCALKIAWRMCW